MITTLAGSAASVHLPAGLTKLLSTGIVIAHPPPEFGLSVLVGATAWAALPTATCLPVSTTHALVGSLVGAGLVAPVVAGAVAASTFLLVG